MQVLQTCVPDYRLGFFSLLEKAAENLKIYSGETYYQESIRDAARGKSWHRMIKNCFLFGRRVLWQQLPEELFITDDVVIAEANPRNLSTWVLAGWRKLLGRPMIFWGHAWARSGQASRTRWLRLLMWRLCDAKIVYTCEQVRELEVVLPGPIFPARNALYSETMIKKRAAKERNNFIYVGRLVADKKPELLVRGFALLTRYNKSVKLDIVGDGPERPHLELLCREMNLSDKVRFHGHIGEMEQLEQLYDKAIAAVSPGYVGLSATQAFFFGVPMLVAEKEPHAPEIEACRSGFNTIFFSSNNALALAQCLDKVYVTKEDWYEKSVAIQNDVCAHYSIEKMVESFLYAGQIATAIAKGK
ncbi:glycosyltransferase [Opitutaceae bacterium TAV1]|nr:glycosyltransferase [Opitutaceae bacterium TAV1]